MVLKREEWRTLSSWTPGRLLTRYKAGQMYCVRSDTENCYLKRRNLSVRQDMSCWYSKLNDLEETDRAGGMHSPALGLITALRKFVI